MRGTALLLFGIIGRICENPRIKPAYNSIAALYHYSMLVGFYEFVVKQYGPLRM
jgi:hypothetical protein